MYFNVDLPFTLLFEPWIIDTNAKLALAFFGVFFLTVVMEGIKSLRERLLANNLNTNCQHCRRESLQPSHLEKPNEATSSRTQITNSHEDAVEHRVSRPGFRRLGYCSVVHFVQTGLHMVYLFISYMVMLTVMTYNAYILLAVIFGAGFGYYVFFQRRLLMFNEQDCCH